MWCIWVFFLKGYQDKKLNIAHCIVEISVCIVYILELSLYLLNEKIESGFDLSSEDLSDLIEVRFNLGLVIIIVTFVA